MGVSKCGCLLLLLCCLVAAIENETDDVKTRSPRRISKVLSVFGLGPRCNGCPPHYCDDDPAVVLGYCCGCAGIFDHLPIVCSPYLNCPPNNFLLCQDYQYMLHCCC